MSALLANNKEYLNALRSSKSGLKDPLDKYMKGEFPQIYPAYPTSAYLYVEPKKIIEWDTFPVHKLIALPFGFDTRIQSRHHNIRARLLAAVVEITKAQQVGIAMPGPNNRVGTKHREMPIAFLIHNLTEAQYLTLLKQEIWISSNISFQVVITTPTSPDYLLTLHDMAMVGIPAVQSMIEATWNEKQTQAALAEIAQEAEAKETPTKPDIPAFLKTITLRRYNTIKNGILAPIFNVYAEGAFIEDEDIWTQIRKTLLKLLRTDSAYHNLTRYPY
jgi:hypothetical protein